MLKILISGGFDEDDKKSLEAVQTLARHLGEQVVRRGHTLLSGCRTSLDAVVAEGAAAAVQDLKLEPETRIISYVMAGEQPAFGLGSILMSRLSDWELGSPRLRVPEPIEQADAVILLGGFKGTHRAANWARIARKPILPIPRFGGAAKDIYHEELDSFRTRSSSDLEQSEFESLSEMTPDLEKLAGRIVGLAEKACISSNVFTIMSFAEEPSLADAFESFQSVCDRYGYRCRKIDEESDVERILPEILSRIRSCAFVIADLTEPRPNVYYELGYAEGLGKPLIVTAKKDTSLPFDTKDIPVIFWENQKGLKEKLAKKVAHIASRQGRSAG
jgi:hypothetical protein